MLTTKERIISSKQLADKVEVALSNAQKVPLVVTENGTPTAYLISVDLFDKLLARLEALDEEAVKTAVSVAENQFAQGQ